MKTNIPPAGTADQPLSPAELFERIKSREPVHPPITAAQAIRELRGKLPQREEGAKDTPESLR